MYLNRKLLFLGGIIYHWKLMVVPR